MKKRYSLVLFLISENEEKKKNVLLIRMLKKYSNKEKRGEFMRFVCYIMEKEVLFIKE